jgi:hypothetical protein
MFGEPIIVELIDLEVVDVNVVTNDGSAIDKDNLSADVK